MSKRTSRDRFKKFRDAGSIKDYSLPPKKGLRCPSHESGTSPRDEQDSKRLFQNNLGSSDSSKKRNTRDHLREICQRYGRKSQELITECDFICKQISSIVNVDKVYPAWNETDSTKIVFVVTHTGTNVDDDIKSKFKDHEEIDVITKAIDCFQNNCKDYQGHLREEDKERLEKCIDKNVTRLAKKHRYLTLIEGCASKMKDDNDNIEPRLGLYVPAKGYIPIDEDPFDESYDGIRVDVREAVYERFRKFANDVHKHVKMGCRVQRERKVFFGTLGLFVQHPEYGLCGVTCAHVLLDDDEMKVSNNKAWHEYDPKNVVHQPSPPHDIGVIREVIVKESARNPTGVEIAVIQIKKRGPNSGQFPAPRKPQPHGNGLEFNSGRICHQPNPNDECFKFGSISDYTTGTVTDSIGNAAISRDEQGNWRIMRRQIKIQSSCSKPFAIKGDSGGPVFVHDSNGEVACIGLIESGCRSRGEFLVTPISTILQELRTSQLIPFHPKNALLLQELADLKRDQSVISETLTFLKHDHSVINEKLDRLLYAVCSGRQDSALKRKKRE